MGWEAHSVQGAGVVTVLDAKDKITIALRERGFDAQIIRTTTEGNRLVVLFTIHGTSGKRLALTAFITARPGLPAGTLDANPRIEIREGFV